MDYETLLLRYRERFRADIVPATKEQINSFIINCKNNNIPQPIQEELIEYYKTCKSFFGYFDCDDEAIFEWIADDCLWLGQQDLWTFRCMVTKHKYAIGDAGGDSFGEEYEFDTIFDMLEGYLSEKTV